MIFGRARVKLPPWLGSRQLGAASIIRKEVLAQVADHIDHVRQVAGVEHVGLGGDFDGTRDVTVGLEDVSTYPALFAELLARGWTEPDCAALAGGNVLRVLRAAESAAAKQQA